ncbi:hypothetical protein ACIGZJ_30870 [Kitasatospora sp. NPDC052868]|uniref:hypothetical protein n=1 Tax=Kitasatospora sp. NPDC052868 TaxID=3364060 RepID=UPI0037C944DA
MSRRSRPRPRGYLALAVRVELLRLRLARTSGELEQVLADAEHDAPVVSGWKVDLDEAAARCEALSEENRALRLRVSELEQERGGAPAAGAGRLEVSPPAVRAEVFARLADAAPSPAGLPQAVVPLWDKDTRRNAS